MTTVARITLKEWCERKWGKHAPESHTRVRWVSERKVIPQQVKIGAVWWVRDYAKHVDELNRHPSTG